MVHVKVTGRERIIGIIDDNGLNALNGYFAKCYVVEEDFNPNDIINQFKKDCPPKIHPDEWEIEII